MQRWTASNINTTKVSTSEYYSKYETLNELQHDKTNKVTVRPVKTQISLGICPVRSESSLSAWRAGVLSYPLSAQRRLWSDWADAQADLSLRWAHTHFVGFVMSQLKCAMSRENMSSGICDQVRLKLACLAIDACYEIHVHIKSWYIINIYGFYAPIFKEVEGVYILVWAYLPVSVCPLRFVFGQEWLEIGSWSLMYGISMKNKWTWMFSSPEPLGSYLSLKISELIV